MTAIVNKELPDFKFRGRPMNRKEMEMLAGILMLDRSAEKPLGDDEASFESISGQIFLSRIEFYGLPFKVSTLFFAMSCFTWVNLPGKIMNLLAMVYLEWKKTGKEYFTIDDWSQTFFPFGIPTDEEQFVWWDSQKDAEGPYGNMVDNPEYWKS